MVPISFIAFYLAALNIHENYVGDYLSFHTYDVLGLIITGLGVMLFNLYKEKPQKVCIEEE